MKRFFVIASFLILACSDQPFVVGVDSPLRVIYLSPPDSATDVSRDVEVKIVLSEDILESTIPENVGLYDFSSKDESRKVDCDITYKKEIFTISLKPKKSLNFATPYLVRVRGGLTKVDTKDSKGGRLARELSSLFTTEYIEDLKVLSVYPANGAKGLSPDTEIKVTFSEPVDNTPPSFDGASSFVVCDMGGADAFQDGKCTDPIAGSWKFDESKKVATFTPEVPFGYARSVRLILATAVRSQRAKEFGDRVGTTYYGHLRSDYIVDFMTELLSPLEVLSVFPSNAATAVRLDTKIAISFSEAVDPGSVIYFNKIGDESDKENTATIFVEDITDNNEIKPFYLDGEWDSEGRVLTLTNVDPSDGSREMPFPYSKDIRITLKSKIRSKRGGSLINPPEALRSSQGFLNNGGADYTSSFSTIDPPELLIVDIRPSSESQHVSIRSQIEILFNQDVDITSFVYPQDINSIDYTFRVLDVTDENNIQIVEPLDTSKPVVSDTNNAALLVFKPKYPFDFLHRYRIEILSGVESAIATRRGGMLKSPVVSSFFTEPAKEFSISELHPYDRSENNGIDSVVRIRTNTAFNTSTLLGKIYEGGVSEILGRVITDENATFIPDSLRGYLVSLNGNNESCSGYIISNSEKSFELYSDPSCKVDNTFTYIVKRPALIVKSADDMIPPTSNDVPLDFYRDYITLGRVVLSDSSSITDTTKNFNTDELKGRSLRIIRGKGRGGVYEIESNTKDTIRITSEFSDQLDNTSEYIVVESADILKTVISSADRRSLKIEGAGLIPDGFTGYELVVLDGTAKGERRGIVANDTDTIYVDSDWERVPDNTSQISIREAREFLFVPENTFAYGSTISAVVEESLSAAVTDSQNGRLDNSLYFSFDIIPAPELVIKSTSPSDASDNISTETTIRVYFSEAVDPATIEKTASNILLIDNDGNPVSFSVVPQGVETDSIEIIPERALLNQPRLRYSSLYKVVLKSGIRSLRGGDLGDDYTFVFKTIDPPPLMVLYSNPSSSSNSISTGIRRETSLNSGSPTPFVLAFSEGVKQSNISNSSLKLEDVSTLPDPFDITQAGTPISYAVSYNAVDSPPDGSLGRGEDSVVTITPSDLIDYSTVVRITVMGEDDPLGSDCAESSTCKTDGIFTSDRATVEGGQLRNSYVAVFRIEDPEPLRIIGVTSERSELYLTRDLSGITEPILVRFSEGVSQSSFVVSNTVFVEDVTGVADLVNGPSRTSIPVNIEFLDSSGRPAPDAPGGTSLIGSDVIARIMPQSLLGYGSVIRLRLKGANPPSMNGIYSDRATLIDGLLPTCAPESGYTCNASGEYVYIFRVERLPDLYVKSISPGDGSREIPQNSRDITIVFSEPLDCNTINSTNIKIEYVYPALLPLNGNFNCNQEMVIFTANSDYGYSKDVRVTVTNGVRSYNAQFVNSYADPLMGHLRSSVSATFSTEDPPAPYIVAMTPGPISTNVARDTEIQILFSEALDPSSVDSITFSITDLSSFSLISCATLEVINSNTTIRCIPQSLFDYSHDIAVSLWGGPAGIRSAIATDRGGWFNPVPNPFTYTFSVIDIPALLVLATNFSGSEDFAPNANLQIIFDSYVNFADVVGDVGNIDDDKIILVKQSDINTRIPVIIENPIVGGESSPSTIRITPTTSLDYGAQYSVFVFGGYPSGVCRPERNSTNKGGCITDTPISGTPYSGLRFDFAVSSAPGLSVVDTIPQDKSTGIDRKPEIRIVFNNPIQFGTVDGNICLTEGDNQSTDCAGPLAVPLEPFTQIDPRTVSTYPQANLNFDTTYTIVITKGVTDIYNDTLDSFFTSVFTTITSTLVMDIMVWDGTQFNNSSFSSIQDVYFRVRFTEDMDTSTLNNNTVYLTYRDEFGMVVPLRGDIRWELAPLDKRVMYFTPSIYDITSCDGGGLYIWGNDGSTKNAPPNEFFSYSINFDPSYIGKILYIRNSRDGYNGYYNIVGVSGGSLVLEGANFTSVESPLSFAILNSIPEIPYDTKFTIHLTANIFNAAHNKNISPTAGDYELVKDFKSIFEPAIDSVVFSSSVKRGVSEYVYVPETNLYNATDVPVISRLKVKFKEKMDATTVDHRSLILADLWGSDGVVNNGSALFKITSGSFVPTDVGKFIWLFRPNKIYGPYEIIEYIDANTVRLNNAASFTGTSLEYIKGINGDIPGVIYTADEGKSIVYDTSNLPEHLEYSKAYRLYIMGRSLKSYDYLIKTSSGNYIKGVHAIEFTTSEETTVKTNPVDWSSSNNEMNDPMLFVAMFSRPVDISSVDETSFYAVQGSDKLPVLYAYYAEFPDIVTLIPIPAFKVGSDVSIYLNQNLRDYRGNPLGHEWKSVLTVASASGGAALTLENPTSIDPPVGSIIKADTKFTLRWVSAGGNFRNLLLPTSFSNYSITLVDNGSGSKILVDTELIPGGNNGDRLVIKPKREMRGGASYTLTVDLTKCANLYRLPGSSVLTYSYTVESTPPTIHAAGPTGSSNPATSRIWIAFNEKISPSSINSSTIIVRNNTTLQQISGVYSQEYDNLTARWIVYFTPSIPLKADLLGYQVTVKSGGSGVKDMGGIPLAVDYTYTFSVENTAPQLLSVLPSSGTTDVPISQIISLNFNEPIDPATIYGANEAGNGSMNVYYTSACSTKRQSYGCIKISPDMMSIIFFPAAPYYLIGDRNYSIDLNETIISDLAGNIMNPLDVGPVSVFGTASSLPALDCVSLPILSSQPLTLSFNEAVDYSNPGSIIVFNVADGSSVDINKTGINGVDGYIVNVTPQVGDWLSGDYGYIVTKDLVDMSGNPLIMYYNGYFTIP